MNVLSLCSGVGGLDLGLERAGMTPVGFCELDPHARSVLARHWPDVPIHDDITTLNGADWHGRVDVVAGGTPCTDLSVAGRRAGLAGEHSRIFWDFCRVAAHSAARWVLWENVAGALSSNGGEDFASVLWGLTGFRPAVPEDGWRSIGVCVGPDRTAVWRLLDARWFGVAQRRRRVFVVAGAGADCRLSLLVEPESVPRGARPGATAGEDIAGTLGGGAGGRGWCPDTDRMTFVPTRSVDTTLRVSSMQVDDSTAQDGHLVYTPLAVSENQRGEVLLTPYAHQIATGGGKPGQGYPAVLSLDWTQNGASVSENVAPSIRVGTTIGVPSPPAVLAFTAKDHGADATEELSPTLRAGSFDKSHMNGGVMPAVAYPLAMRGRSDGAELEVGEPDTYNALRAGNGGSSRQNGVLTPDLAVRRLTPRECSLLMGWPIDYLDLEDFDNDPDTSHAREVLRRLWGSLGAQAVQRASGRLGGLLTPEVLLAGVHVCWIPWTVAGDCAARRLEVQGADAWPEDFVRRLRQYGTTRPSPFGREPFEQLARELGRPLPFVPSEAPPNADVLFYRRVWESTQGPRAVQQALAALAEVGRPIDGERTSIRLADSHKYRMCGNGVVSNCTEWIGRRLMAATP